MKDKRKTAHYYEFRYSDWLSGRISFESNGTRLAYVTIKSLCFQMANEQTVLTVKMAKKHNDITENKLQYLNREDYIDIKDGVVIDDEILYNAEKVQETSELMSILAQIRWKKEEIKEAKKDGRESLFLETKLDELYRQKDDYNRCKNKKK